MCIKWIDNDRQIIVIYFHAMLTWPERLIFDARFVSTLDIQNLLLSQPLAEPYTEQYSALHTTLT
jgi:hypothetical protein